MLLAVPLPLPTPLSAGFSAVVAINLEDPLDSLSRENPVERPNEPTRGPLMTTNYQSLFPGGSPMPALLGRSVVGSTLAYLIFGLFVMPCAQLVGACINKASLGLAVKHIASASVISFCLSKCQKKKMVVGVARVLRWAGYHETPPPTTHHDIHRHKTKAKR